MMLFTCSSHVREQVAVSNTSMGEIEEEDEESAIMNTDFHRIGRDGDECVVAYAWKVSMRTARLLITDVRPWQVRAQSALTTITMTPATTTPEVLIHFLLLLHS